MIKHEDDVNPIARCDLCNGIGEACLRFSKDAGLRVVIPLPGQLP